MKKKLSESDLRIWLRRNWLGVLPDWVEYAIGGTVGLPDVYLPVEGRSIPVELKVAHMLVDGSWTFHVRPSQIRWHEKTYRAGRRSAFMIGVPDPFTVALLPGQYWPASGRNWRQRISWVDDYNSIIHTLTDDRFW